MVSFLSKVLETRLLGIKITASVERVFRLRLAALNDTICLLMAFVFDSRASRLAVPYLVEWGGFKFDKYFCLTYNTLNKRAEAR